MATSTTTNDRDSASVMSSSGFFKRIARKRSIGPSSPTSPSIPDSAPWLPPLEGIDAEQDALPPATTPASPRVQPASAAMTKSPRSTAVPFLNLPSDIAAPVAPPKSSFVPIIKGGPQLPPASSIDTSLHLEFSPSGPVLLPSPSVEKKEPILDAVPKPAPKPASKPKSPPSSPRKETKSPRKEASNASERSTTSKEGSSLTKTLGALFRRGKKDGVDAPASATMLATPDEFGTRSKRMSIPSSLNPLRRNSFTPSRDALVASTAAATVNGAMKTNGHHVDPSAQEPVPAASSPKAEEPHHSPAPVHHKDVPEADEDDFIPVSAPVVEEVVNGHGHGAVAEEAVLEPVKEEHKPNVEEAAEKVENATAPAATESTTIQEVDVEPKAQEAAAPAHDAPTPVEESTVPEPVPEAAKDTA